MAAIPGTPEWYKEQEEVKRRQRKPVGAIFSTPNQQAINASRLKNNGPTRILKDTFTPSPRKRSGPRALFDSIDNIMGAINTQMAKNNPVIGGIGTPAARQFAKNRPPLGIGAVSEILKRGGPGGGQGPGIGDNYTANLGELPEFGKTLADYLKMYGDGSKLAQPILKDIDARSAALRERGSEGHDKIGDAYAALQKSLGFAKEEAAERYSQAQETAEATGRDTQAAISSAREDSKSARDTIRENLGMTDVPMSTSEAHASEAGANDVSRSASVNQTQKNYLQNAGNIAQDYSGSNQVAAGFRGAETQSALQRDLMNSLAGLDSEKAGVLADAQIQAQQLAQAAYNADFGAFTNNRDFAANRDDAAWNRAMDETNMYANYQQGQAEMAARQQEQQEQQQSAILKQQEEQMKATPAYARTAERLRQNLRSVDQDVINNVLNFYSQAVGSDPTDPTRQLTLENLIQQGLTPQQAVFALQEGREYLKAYA